LRFGSAAVLVWILAGRFWPIEDAEAALLNQSILFVFAISRQA
jgi:hypothetical protein